MTDPTDHAADIRAATAVLYRKLDAEGRPRAIGTHLEAIDNAAAALQQQRDFHRDDAAAVRRERDAEINRLAGELAQARARAERYRQARNELAYVMHRARDVEVSVGLDRMTVAEWMRRIISMMPDAGEGA